MAMTKEEGGREGEGGKEILFDTKGMLMDRDEHSTLSFSTTVNLSFSFDPKFSFTATEVLGCS